MDRVHVVVMIEPAREGERLQVSEQINQVFGPFPSGEHAEEWVDRMNVVYAGKRMWLIIPLDNPNVVMKLDIRGN